MNKESQTEGIVPTNEEFDVVPADTDALRHEAYRVRYQVYCVENSFLSGINGLEFDEYDSHARHMLLCHRHTGNIVGTVRLVTPRADGNQADFPMQRFCSLTSIRSLPILRSGEVSRFAISRDRLGATRSTLNLLRLWLVQGAVRMSVEAGHSHWVAILDPRLLRLLSMTAINFRKIGQPIEYHGTRQPAYVSLSTLFSEVREKRPEIWNIITDRGRYAAVSITGDEPFITTLYNKKSNSYELI